MKQSRISKWIDYFIIQRSGYFDAGYYRSNYPDFWKADPNPISHFMKTGWKENLNPSIKFNTGFYLSRNPDVKQVGVNPLIHFLRHGRDEGREPLPGKVSTLSGRYHKTTRADSFMLSIISSGKKMIAWIPIKYRQRLLALIRRYFGIILSRSLQGVRTLTDRRNQPLDASSQNALIDINRVDPAAGAGGSIAIHIHLFYPELAKEFVRYLRNMPYPYDLFLSVPPGDEVAKYQDLFHGLPFCQSVRIERVENRGRDIAPLVCTFAGEIARYTYVAHLHSKKSIYNKGATEGWRKYLCNNLMGSPDRIKRIFQLMQGDQPFGIVYPQNYSLLPYWANTWLANKALGQAWCTRLGISDIPRGYFNYPASSMFWARGDALAPLVKSGIRIDEFPEEIGQTDGTLAHCLERLFVLCSLKQGMPPSIIADQTIPSWSAWRIDQYTRRTTQDILNTIHDPSVQLIAFDIFDTLLCRPLLDPESIKKLVSQKVGGDEGELFRMYRSQAEQEARDIKGKDVGLDEIYLRFGKLSGLSNKSLAELQSIELAFEEDSQQPRGEVIALYQQAVATGKKVVLISDMFLPQSLLEKCLKKHLITGWDAFFLSNSIGLRKDSGELYKHVLAHYGLEPAAMLMIGDNERSDVQIPCDMGARYLHVFNPKELARGLPRFSNLIQEHDGCEDLNAEMTLGLVVRKNFTPISLDHFDPDSLVAVNPYNWGYSLVGPLLVSFAGWLVQKAKEDHITRLYFLSREGKVIKQLYDAWVEGDKSAPKSEYLVVSRRAAGVAAISNLQDILDIAKTTFYPNTIESFLLTRYGLVLEESRWAEISKNLGVNRTTDISIFNHKIDHLVPLLQSLDAEIISNAQSERAALLKYLIDHKLTHDDQQAVVDIGYGGSVQKYLSRLLTQKIHGYYMMTEERARDVAKTHEVLIRACYIENIDTTASLPILFKHSFEIEKLLSSDDPQIEFYHQGRDGKTSGQYRELTAEEVACTEIRKSLHQGALDYARDARQLRKSLLPDFQPAPRTAQSLMEAFLTSQSEAEVVQLSKIVLDDHYCGRGLIS